jgi:hypothetical protein
MSWEITMRRADKAPLGDRACVKLLMTLACPALRYMREPSGPEKIAAARTAGVEFPDIIRTHLEQQPPTEVADYVGDGFSVRYFLGSEGELDAHDAEVRGDTQRALPFFQQLAARMNWVVAETGSDRPLFQ